MSDKKSPKQPAPKPAPKPVPPRPSPDSEIIKEGGYIPPKPPPK